MNFLVFFSSSLIVLRTVSRTELPSINISLFFSKISEKINNSKTQERSENFITAYGLPLLVFLSCTFKIVAAIFASFKLSLLEIILLKKYQRF